ncbi:hypothetical protein ATEIFO6365_0001032500 [Aspergillus terreus]|uniref:Uncharacterized protein n=1 Tax=Aspergillus terreus TaxID=33178 RepID=A0A5M3YM98_ASPTE|nr:hypothetical protein ATETN484_0001024600 [Aspergillus terreus]GFF12102.1 hypothetical protein ATEIFO6365_0001032500 [Aspergillus terreus]
MADNAKDGDALREGVKDLELRLHHSRWEYMVLSSHFQALKREHETELRRANEQVVELTRQLNSLQFTSDILCDDEASARMKHLNYRLERWVATHFNDRHALKELVLEEANVSSDELWSVSAQRAAFHSRASSLIWEPILSQFMLGAMKHAPGLDQYLAKLREAVFHQCPQIFSQQWDLATRTGVEHMMSDTLDTICMSLAQEIESKLAKYSNTDSQARTMGLKQLILDCHKLKQRLEHQEHAYYFAYSKPGGAYNPDAMQSLTDCKRGSLSVKLSMWPGLRKLARHGEYVIEREVVWTESTEPCYQESEWSSTEESEESDEEEHGGLMSDGGEVVSLPLR